MIVYHVSLLIRMALKPPEEENVAYIVLPDPVPNRPVIAEITHTTIEFPSPVIRIHHLNITGMRLRRLFNDGDLIN